MPAKRKRALTCVSSLELENALQLFVKNWVRENGAVDDKKHPFELLEYRMLEFGQSPNGTSLAKLAPLLLQLLSVAANAVVNQKSLEVALRELAAHERNLQLLSPTLTEAHWSSWLAGQLRTALSHCRKLKLRPKLMQQTLRKTPGCYHQALKELAEAVDVEGELMDGVSDGNLEALALADELVHAASSAEAAPKTPPCKRRVRRKTADDAEDAAEPLRNGSPAAALARSTPRRRRLRRKESEASVDFNLLLSSPVARGSGSAGSGSAGSGSAVTVTPGQCGLLMNLLSAAPRPAGNGAQGAQVSSFCQNMQLRKPLVRGSAARQLRLRLRNCKRCGTNRATLWLCENAVAGSCSRSR